MSLNIEDIKIVEKRFSILNELRDFSIIFIIIVCFGWLFINGQLLVIVFDDILNKKSVSANEIKLYSSKKAINLSSLEKQENGDNMEQLKKRLLKENLSKKFSNVGIGKRTDIIYKPSYEAIVKKNLKSYNMNFNILPPDNRLTIPAIGVDVHVVTLTNVPIKTIQTANYDEYLYNGVVKYPYTSDPGITGNVFIFGHTSYYWWKHNPYGSIFAKITQLKDNDMMQLTWKGKEYKYKIFKKIILSPYQVDDIYQQYQDGEYLTIMGCYPIGSDRQRMLVIAKKE